MSALAEREGAELVKIAQVIRAPGKSVLNPAPEAIAVVASSPAGPDALAEEKLCHICKYPIGDPRCIHWGPDELDASRTKPRLGVPPPQWVTSWPNWHGIEGNVTVVPLEDYLQLKQDFDRLRSRPEDRDAERYRWLYKMFPLQITRLVHGVHTHGPTSTELSAAIDATMSQQEPTKEK